MIYTLTLGRHQLAISLGRKRGRPVKTPLIQLKESIAYLIKLTRDRRRAGHPISRIFRCLFENKQVKKILGFNLAAVVLLAGSVGSPASALSRHPQGEITTLNPATEQLTTEQSVRSPLDSLVVTQGYHFFHRAVDLNGQLGEPVYPIMDGAVEDVFYNRFSYGNHLIINHGSGFKSLYAHLAKIVVEEGEEVDKNTVIGTVGTTGWATGPHLHLEIWDNGQPINPLTILR